MTPKSYSPFWALLIFFSAVIVFDLDQSVKLHREKLVLMQQYGQTLKLQEQIDEQMKWVQAMQKDLLRLAPGHPEASQIVAEFNLQPKNAGEK